MRKTVASYLGDFISRGSETAFAYRRGLRVVRWSYEQVATTAFQFARELETRGIGKADRVLLCAENSPQWVASFFGCILRGAIVVPLDVQSDRGFVGRVQKQVEAKLALGGALMLPMADLDLPVLRLEELGALVAHHSPAFRKISMRMTLWRSFSPQARPPNPRASASRIAICSQTSIRLSRRLSRI